MPCAVSAEFFQDLSANSRARPRDGSSSSSSFWGCAIRPRAIATICCSPTGERFREFVSSRSPGAGILRAASSSTMLSVSSGREGVYAPKARFPRALVRNGKPYGSGTMLMPFLRIDHLWRVYTREMSRASMAVRRVRGLRPEITRRMVVCPHRWRR